MKQGYSHSIFGLIVLVLIAGGVLKAQNANPLIHAMSFKGQRVDTSKVNNLLKGAIEDVSKRTIFSSTWRTKAGKIMAHYSSAMVNYPDANGSLQPIDLTLHSDAQGWVADKQPNPCYFHSDRSTVVTLGNGRKITFNKNCTVNGMPLQQNIVSLEKSDVKLDLSQGIHKELNFVTDGIETNYIFDSPLDSGDIQIAEEIELPAGCTFQKDADRGSMQSSGWSGDYVLLAPDGKQVLARMLAAECYDAKKHWCFASYNVQKKDGKNILVTSIPSSWLSKAVYPVTLDPLIIGTTSNYAGASTVSCLYPNFYTDSIQVTIPANITISYFTVDYAYVSSTTLHHTIPVSDGIFYISTACGRTDTISCADSPGGGDTAGVCYLDPYESFTPLTCCFEPSCSTQTFWVDAHLSRRQGGTGCDSTTIWYEKGGYTGFKYHFSAWLEGYTDSTTSVKYTPVSQCSNVCTIKMNAVIQYGVPPYKVTHPWAVNDTVVGSYNSCISEGVVNMTLKVPGCPYTCGQLDSITIPSPTVVDACGDIAAPVKPVRYAIKPVPVITYHAIDTSVCSGLPVVLSLQSCVPGTTFSWKATDHSSGTKDSIVDHTHDTGNMPMVVTYTITGSANGCNADSVVTTAVINPFPSVSISGGDTLILGNSEHVVATGGKTYSWSPSTGLSCTKCPDPIATPTITTQYQVTVADSGGCEAIIPFTIYVLDQNVIIPNVITPNGDGVNDYFFITNLNIYPNSKLTILDRWGRQIYTSDNYLNNWNGGGQSDGVYYYILTLSTAKKYQGFFQIIN